MKCGGAASYHDLLPSGFVAQLVEHQNMGVGESNTFEVLLGI